MKNIFITGIDTDVGKTLVSIGICLKKEAENFSVGYYKPLQSGAYEKYGNMIAPDIEEIKKYSNVKSKFSYLFKGEVSPNLASYIDNVSIDISKIKTDFINFSSDFDFTLSEGAGGLYCPAFKNTLFSDIIKILNQEIIIVTTPKLGSLNHTLMTIECARLNNIKIKGLIVNKIPKNQTLSEKKFIEELKMFTDVKILGQIPCIDNLSKDTILNAFKNVNL